jgi:hypothetical protein
MRRNSKAVFSKISRAAHAYAGDRARHLSILSPRAFGFSWLVLITLVAASASFRGIVPLDARTNGYLTNHQATFEFSLLGTIIEPFSAVAYALVGAPDYRIAALSTICWLFVFLALLFYWSSPAKRRVRVRLCAACVGAFSGILAFVLYALFAIMLPLPSWALVEGDGTTVVADLHSHTTVSHDGLDSIDQSLQYHRSHGYDVVAITDHFSKTWMTTQIHVPDDSGRTMETIRGTEIGAQGVGKNKIFLLILGIPFDVALPVPLLEPEDGDRLGVQPLRQFIDFVHAARGIVFAASYRLLPGDIDRLIEAGADGFEIANFGHPNLTLEMRLALLRAQQEHRIALLANSDWHGWSNFAKTWTLVHVSDANKPRAEAVLDALRARDPDQVVPVVSQPIGQPSLWRAAFAPLVETVRYARELTPLRLASWWLWFFVLAEICILLRRAGYSPSQCLITAALAVMGTGFLFRGLALMVMWGSGTPFRFPLQIGAGCCGLGVASFVLMGGIYWLRSRWNAWGA